MRERFATLLKVLSTPAVALGGSAIIAIAAVGITWHLTSVSPTGSYTSATVGPITEEVMVSGTVKAAQDTDLSFAAAGQVASINVAVGDHVSAGETLASLDGRSQSAALEGAQANLEMQQANLASLQAGTRPEQLAIDQSAATQADATLANATQSSYVTADDAVHAKADQLFSNPRSTSPTLNINVPDLVLSNKIQNERAALEPVMTTWEESLSASTSTLATNVTLSQTNLSIVNAFLADIATALAETPAGGSVTQAAISGYQTSIDAARLNVSGALTTLTNASTGDAAAQGALTLAQAGATANAIAAQQALVDSAKASVDAATVALSQSAIVAPLSGTITVQNANIGQTISPGAPLISMIADGKFEADAQVSESDAAKIKLGDAVNATFSAYPNVNFPGTVTTIDPSATITNGVASYQVTITFAQADPRIQSGLTANLDIITQTKDQALQVPQSAIITDGATQFVYVENSSGDVKTPVETGIEGANGMTEITSGLTAGANVLTFGSQAD